MKTELEVSSPQPIAGMKIAMDLFNLKNFRMHKMSTDISRILLFILESDSNNSSAQVVARDARNVQLALAAVEKEFGYLKNYRDSPMGILERGYTVLLPKASEVQRMNNRPMQCVAQEILNFANVVVFNDSSQQQQWSGAGPTADIEDALNTLKTIIAETIGSGALDQDHPSGYNVGPQHADYSRLGTLVPDVDLDKVTLAEPRVGEVAPPRVPDTPDLPSNLPAGRQ